MKAFLALTVAALLALAPIAALLALAPIAALLALAPIAALLALAPIAAQAHDCDPLAVSATGVQIGTPMRTVTTNAGKATVWWCQFVNASTPAGMVNWRTQIVVDLADCRYGITDVATAAARVVAAGTGAYAQFETELRAAMAACIVVEGTPRHYEVRKLRHVGCIELANNPPAGTPVDWLKPAGAPSTWVPADWCGPAPVPPAPPPAPAWATMSTITYNTSGGALSGIAGSVALGVACNCAAPVRVGTATYCTFAGAPRATVVARCKQP
jgi:hypothetical protein